MRKVKDKIAQPCSMAWLPISAAEIETTPGSIYITVTGEWEVLPIREITFKEEQANSGKLVSQEFNCVVTGVSESEEYKLLDRCNRYGVIRIDYSNGIKKVIGTKDVPVRLSFEKSGSPSLYTISCKRSSPEFAKLLD